MAFRCWRQLVDQFEKRDLPGLPDPNDDPTPSDKSACGATNKEIDKVVQSSAATSKKQALSARLAMARCCTLHGLAAASKHFSEKFGRKVTYITVHSMVEQYKKTLGKFDEPAGLNSLPHKPRER